MKKLIRLKFFAVPLAVWMFASSLLGSTYESFKGGFYFIYPEDWVQIPYLTADLFLSRASGDPSSLDYEAVFAPKASSPFFQSDYLILTVDTVEWLYEYKIDSIVDEMEKSFGEDVKYFPAWDQPTDLKSYAPAYDKANRIISVVNNIVSGDRILKRNLTVKKFYDKGIANFYFYSPDTLFEKSRSTFVSMVNSFSTENVSEATPKESGKVIDTIARDELDFRKMLIPIGAAIIILFILLARIKKARKVKPTE
ncbi:MAG: hypothetical protein ACREBV_00010 [Candidatus Zixiibacteriota bacterium]